MVQLVRQAVPPVLQVYGEQLVVEPATQDPAPLHTLAAVKTPPEQLAAAHTVPLVTLLQAELLTDELHTWQGKPGRKVPLA